MITHIFVAAAIGREVPIPTAEATAPGGALLRCLPGKVYRLPYSTYTRKRVASGDLFLVDRSGGKVRDFADASAPDVLELDDTGAVATEVQVHEASFKSPPAPKFDTTDTHPRKG